MPYATINKPTQHFNTVTYSGTGSNQTITVGFQPDLVWTKGRNLGYSHEIQDAVRGTTKVNYSDKSNVEDTTSTNIQSFNSTGYVQGSGTGVNGSGYTFVSWNWLASNTTASNNSGSITSTVSANTTSGFSIVTYTGNGTSGATFGHGLGVAPAFTIVKNRSTGGRNWQGFHKFLGNTKSNLLNSTEVPRTNAVFWNNTSPTSTLITLGNDADVNESGQTFIAYCFAEVKGYSKFGSYTGNGSSDGPFVYTGFKPAFVMVKASSTTSNWNIYDDMRPAYNQSRNPLYANTSDVEPTTGLAFDILSNGFKWREGGGQGNDTGVTFIYMAFAEQPLVGTNNVPATAR